jgi:hypothetical protein
MDQLLLGMGITGQLARTEILDQSEGRPGWAISIGDMLLRVALGLYWLCAEGGRAAVSAGPIASGPEGGGPLQ